MRGVELERRFRLPDANPYTFLPSTPSSTPLHDGSIIPLVSFFPFPPIPTASIHSAVHLLFDSRTFPASLFV